MRRPGLVWWCTRLELATGLSSPSDLQCTMLLPSGPEACGVTSTSSPTGSSYFLAVNQHMTTGAVIGSGQRVNFSNATIASPVFAQGYLVPNQ